MGEVGWGDWGIEGEAEIGMPEVHWLPESCLEKGEALALSKTGVKFCKWWREKDL